MNKNSLFIAFEGLDGCGKSLQAQTLYSNLQSRTIPSILLHEPGSTPLGEEINRLLKWSGKIALDPLTELLLFNASRAQLVKEVIIPSLDQGMVVVIDRFTDSTLAYQGYGRELDLEMVTEINNIATRGCQPDYSILLDISPEEALKRQKAGKDRFEAENPAFHRKIRQGYLTIAEEEPERWLVIDATLSKDIISQIIRENVNRYLIQPEL